MIYGEPGSGKSFWVLDLCLHVADGIPYCGRAVERGAIIYLALEGGSGIRNRITAARERMGLPATTPLILIQCPVDLRRPDADVPKVIATIRLVAKKFGHPVRAIVVDTLARALAGGNENGSEDMGALVGHADLIRHETGACVIFIHHCGKDAARGMRGHNSLEAATDTAIEVTRGCGKVLTATVVRQRDLEGGQAFAFTLDPVTLGSNQRGKRVTSCVVVPTDIPAEAGNAKLIKLTDTEQIGLRMLDRAMDASGIMATVFDGGMEGSVVREADWRSMFYREGKPGADPEAKRKAFQRAVDGLTAKGRIGSRDEFVWPKGGTI